MTVSVLGTVELLCWRVRPNPGQIPRIRVNLFLPRGAYSLLEHFNGFP